MVLNATRDAELPYRAAEFVEKAEAAAEDSVDASSYLTAMDLVDDDALRVDNASEVCTAADDDIATTAAAAVSVAPDATANGGSAADAPRQAGRTVVSTPQPRQTAPASTSPIPNSAAKYLVAPAPEDTGGGGGSGNGGCQY